MQTENFKKEFICAKYDKPFYVLFKRASGNKYRIAGYEVARKTGELVAVDDRKNEILATLGLQPKETNISMEQIDISGYECPLCQNDKTIVQCGTCDSLVCSGNSTSAVFHCRPSCQASSEFDKMDRIKNIKDIEEQKSATPQKLENKNNNKTLKQSGIKLLGRQ